VTFSPSGRDSPSTTIRPSRTVPVMIFMVVILPPRCVDLSSAQRLAVHRREPHAMKYSAREGTDRVDG
jgi:hypothetical protein